MRSKPLADKVAIVTGGNSGIGEATVLRLAREGAKVGILARRAVEGRAVEQAVASTGGKAAFFACDVTERADIEEAVAQVVGRYGGVHVLFNNAGGAERDPFPAPGGDAAWARTLQLNLTSAYTMTQVVWPHLVAAGGGSIINMSSTAAVMAGSPRMLAVAPFLPPVAYWVAKAGMEALTRYTATAGAPHSIRANAVRPGQIVTPMTARVTPGHTFAEAMFAETQITAGAGYPEDVANLVYFLASEESRFINAQILAIDGGWVAKV